MSEHMQMQTLDNLLLHRKTSQYSTNGNHGIHSDRDTPGMVSMEIVVLKQEIE
jgi:hypothetical protein